MRCPVSWLSLPLLGAVLAGCPAHEGPIDVILVDMDDTAQVSWRLGDGDFAPCENGTTNPEAYVGCGKYGVGEPGTYTIRVAWSGATLDQQLTIERDRDYRANAEITFTADQLLAE
jgi:hypothetical protein